MVYIVGNIRQQYARAQPVFCTAVRANYCRRQMVKLKLRIRLPRGWIIREWDQSIRIISRLVVPSMLVTDQEAIGGLKILSQTEGIIPALETSHAIGYLARLDKEAKKNSTVIVCLSGRGDKDVNTMKELI